MGSPILDSDVLKPLKMDSRRKLLPWWIKLFIWIFLIMGAFVPIIFLLGIFGVNVHISYYGMDAQGAFSYSGLLILALISLKGITAYGLWSGKYWALDLGIIDAVVGILICIYLMFTRMFSGNENGFIFTFRIELILLVPYLLKL